ncbi:MAG TPA: hypothetical protein VGU01_00490 [Sphingomicrobium sp.]|nr:hypothetical protein [Sphingomicrobium sp.]
MASKAQQLPSHYEMLGLTPGASQDEIARAFASAMSMFGVRPVAIVAHISQAFETLRNPEKRRLYDRSIGVEPTQHPYQWRISIAAHPLPPFVTAEKTRSDETSRRAALLEPQETDEHHPSLLPDAQAADAKLSALIRSLHELAEPTVRSRPTEVVAPLEVQRPSREAADECALPSVDYVMPIHQAEKALLRAANHPFDWRRPLLTLGGLVLGAGLVGTVAGLSIPTDPQSAVTTPIPPAKARANARMKPPLRAAPAVDDDVRAQGPRTPLLATPASRVRHEFAHRQLAHNTEPKPADALPADGATPSENVDSAADPLAPEVTAPQRVAARLPLPKSVIARTIEKIGYACGSVNSLTPIEGARGTFQVNCASGQSYRAAPVGGRYHFRKL